MFTITCRCSIDTEIPNVNHDEIFGVRPNAGKRYHNQRQQFGVGCPGPLYCRKEFQFVHNIQFINIFGIGYIGLLCGTNFLVGRTEKAGDIVVAFAVVGGRWISITHVIRGSSVGVDKCQSRTG